jgi:hypothetical protein
MQPQTLLLRQVHPKWIKDGHVMSLAFRPFPKDDGLLSVYDGDKITCERSWSHYTQTLGYPSDSVWAVTVAEAAAVALSARPHPVENFPEHSVIDFTQHARKQQEAKAKIMAAKAEERGRLYSPPPA